MPGWEGRKYNVVECVLRRRFTSMPPDCVYPKTDTNCQNCSVYQGFMDNERYRLEIQKLESSE